MVLDVKTMVSLGISVVGYLIAVIQFVIKAIKNAKEKKWTSLRDLLKAELIPLMEQAEKAFDDGEEKENWVIKKLSDKVHIDFYKYKNILTLAKEIITEICEQTKIEVNKTIVIESKKETVEEKEDGSNGVF